MPWGAAMVALVAAQASAAEPLTQPGQEVVGRRSTSGALALEYERYVTANGLVVLLSPDPSVNQVVVDLGFAAGALYEPQQRNGLAHLTEHALSTGDTPDTDYRAMLEGRGALDFNGLTTADWLSWRLIVPPEELPLALWANADRLGTLPGLLTPEALARHRRIVQQERLLRLEDSAYGRSEQVLMARLFPRTHPLHQGVFGTPSSLEAIGVEDVRAFAARYLVPANGVLTITGNFDPKVAREWIDKTLGRLPPGQAAQAPPATPALPGMLKVKIDERVSRRPRVTMAWPLEAALDEYTEALALGATLLSIYSDELIGLSVDAELLEFRDSAIFILNVTMPHAVDLEEAEANAEVIFRFLAAAPMPVDLVVATQHAIDRALMTALSSPPLRAGLLNRLERFPPRAMPGVPPTERHWKLTAEAIQTRAARALKGARLTVQARPSRPLPPKVKR
ncbi:MAG: insulinase family protein [Myxococcales bacterium]|nr:insulinase family protein [Myxococcales bacterium]